MAPPRFVALLLLNAALKFSRKFITEFCVTHMAPPKPFVSPSGSSCNALFESNCITEFPLKVMSQLSYAETAPPSDAVLLVNLTSELSFNKIAHLSQCIAPPKDKAKFVEKIHYSIFFTHERGVSFKVHSSTILPTLLF